MDPCHSELETDRALLEIYIQNLERAFGHSIKVVGIVEIGSFAKHEAVGTSDIDTRVYVTSEEGYAFNVFPSLPGEPFLYQNFLQANKPLPRIDFHWQQFNDPLADAISTQLPRNIEFAFADWRYASYELSLLDQYASPEHSLLFQSNILYDPERLLHQQREELRGKIFAPLAKYYQEQHLDRLWFRIYQSLTPSEDGHFKLRKSGQILWVQMAVRCLRNAAAAKAYITTGEFIFHKQDVLNFYAAHLPGDFPLVDKLYQWKTDPAVRVAMVQDFREHREKYYQMFREITPQIECVVRRVKEYSHKKE